MKTKIQHTQFMGCSGSSAKMEMYGCKHLPYIEERMQINDLVFHLMKQEEKQINSKQA